MMHNLMYKHGYISVEVVIVAAIVLIGGTIGVSKYSAKGKETTAKTNNTVAKVYKDYGDVDISSADGSGKNDGNGGGNTIKTDGINIFAQQNLELIGSDYSQNTIRVNGKTIVVKDNVAINAYYWPTFTNNQTVENIVANNYQQYYLFSGEIKTTNLKDNGAYLYFDFRKSKGLDEDKGVKIPINPKNDGEWQTLSAVIQIDRKDYKSAIISITSRLKPVNLKDTTFEYKNFKLEKVISN